jgi:hypothetical protein
LVGTQFTAEPSILGKVFYEGDERFGVITPERFTIEWVEFPPPPKNRWPSEEGDYTVILGAKFQSGKSANLYIQASSKSLALNVVLSVVCPELSDIVNNINHKYCKCK